jgi:regulatory factor X 1/2/3
VEHRLPKDSLYAVSKMAAVQNFVRRSDYAFYQALVEVLIPDVLRPIPSENPGVLNCSLLITIL